MDTILNIKDIHKSFAANYGRRGRVFGNEYKNVINGLSANLERGSITALVGGNGAGKTSLFNIISGLLRPEAGSVVFNKGKSSLDCTLATPYRIASGGVGRMFQGTRVFGELSVIDHLLIQARPAWAERPFNNVLFPVKNRKSGRELKEGIYEAMKEFDEFRELWKDGEKPASSLSYARQRMLSLAGLLIGNYDLLLLDEPSSGLNPGSFDTLYKFLNMMQAGGKTIFLIEHNMNFIKMAVDHCHYMAEGRILFAGTPEEVLEHDEVKQSYLL